MYETQRGFIVIFYLWLGVMEVVVWQSVHWTYLHSWSTEFIASWAEMKKSLEICIFVAVHIQQSNVYFPRPVLAANGWRRTVFGWY